jgi:hypothetical protein
VRAEDRVALLLGRAIIRVEVLETELELAKARLAEHEQPADKPTEQEAER